MSIFTLEAGGASNLIRSQPRKGLGPKQIAWCRQNIPLFAVMQDRAVQAGREAEDIREVKP